MNPQPLLRSWFCVMALPIVCLMAASGVGAADEESKELIPQGTVIDTNQQPLAEVVVALHRWDGVMSDALQTMVTDAEGRFEFPSRGNDAYYYVILRKASFAPTGQIVSAEGPLKITLRPAVDAWIEVRNATGQPLAGARIANITIRTEGNSQDYLWRGMEHFYGLKFLPSDADGRLKLPPLPQSALIDIRIDHPDWAQAKVSNVRVAAGRLTEATLPAGVRTTFEFVADSRAPVALDALTCEVLMLSQSSGSPASILRLPMTIVGDQIRLCAHPVAYDSLRLTAPDLVITPEYDRLTIAEGTEPKMRFLVRPAVQVSGRVLRKDGTPHRGVSVLGQVENVSPDGRIPDDSQWKYSGNVETDAEGRYTLTLAPGRSRVEVNANGYVTDREETEIDVSPVGPNDIPDFLTEVLEPVRGQVVDHNGQPASGAIVRLRFPSLWDQPTVTDADGRFEIKLRWIPVDLETHQRQYELDVAAFVTDRPVMGIAQIDLRDAEWCQRVRIELRPDASADELLTLKDNQWNRNRMQKLIAEGKIERHPAGEPGQPAPELDGLAWFNTEGKGLQDFRGRYVLLDFWFTNCGPCHADFPTVKLIHERFEKHGVTVIGVHDNSSTPDAVQEHCRQQGLTFPMVVDHADGRIVNAYRDLGLSGFPTYLLIGPDGKIVQNDRAIDGRPSLRTFKLEIIRRHVLHHGE